MTQPELAERVSKSASYVSQCEREERSPSVKYCLAVAAALGATAAETQSLIDAVLIAKVKSSQAANDFDQDKVLTESILASITQNSSTRSAGLVRDTSETATPIEAVAIPERARQLFSQMKELKSAIDDATRDIERANKAWNELRAALSLDGQAPADYGD